MSNIFIEPPFKKDWKIGWIEDDLLYNMHGISTEFIGKHTDLTEEDLAKVLGIYKEDIMNAVIAEVYEVTKDAVLVNKYFGNEISQNFSGKMLLIDHKEEYLVEAKRREEESKLKK